MERDPEFGTDRLTSAVMEFPSGHSVFTCGTQLVPYQRMQFLGAKGRIEIKIPFNAPNDRPCEIFVDDGRDVLGSGVTTEISHGRSFGALKGILISIRPLEIGRAHV